MKIYRTLIQSKENLNKRNNPKKRKVLKVFDDIITDMEVNKILSPIVTANYSIGNEVIYSTEVLKSNLCDYNDPYILVRGDITIVGHKVTQEAFKNCAPFTKCITKSDGKTIDDAKYLDLVMAMYK